MYPFEHSTVHSTFYMRCGLGDISLILGVRTNSCFLLLEKRTLNLSSHFTVYLSSTFHFEQAEILAKFKPKLDTSTLIANIRNIEKAIKDCLDHFKSTRHMILYYEDIIGNSNVVNSFNKCPNSGSTNSQVI